MVLDSSDFTFSGPVNGDGSGDREIFSNGFLFIGIVFFSEVGGGEFLLGQVEELSDTHGAGFIFSDESEVVSEDRKTVLVIFRVSEALAVLEFPLFPKSKDVSVDLSRLGDVLVSQEEGATNEDSGQKSQSNQGFGHISKNRESLI